MPSVTFYNPGIQNDFDNELVNLPLMASSSSSNPLSFSEVGLPAGLGLTNNMGIPAISGTIAGDADLWAPYSVSITATDTVTGEYDTQAFTWNVSYAAPTAWNNSMPLDVLRRNLTDAIDLSQYASGGDGTPLQFSISAQPGHGELNAIGGSYYVYMSDASYTGQDSFQFQATDGRGSSNTATFTFNVTNTAPTVTATNTYYVLEGQTITISDLATYGTSASNPALTASLAQQAMSGQAVDLGNGQVQYTAPNYAVSDMFGFKLNDGVTDSSMAYAHINVVDQPIAANDVRKQISGLESIIISPSELLANAKSTMSNPTWQVTSVGTPVLGQMTDNGDGTWTYSPPANAVVGFEDSLAFTVTDGVNNAAASLVLLVPDRPPLGAPQLHPERNFRARGMALVTNLFPQFLAGNAYAGMNQAMKDAVNEGLALSIHQGYVGGDSALAATTAAAVRQRTFTWLQTLISEVRDPQTQAVTGYRVWFVAGAEDVRIPAFADRAAYGCAFDNAGVSLWYTVLEMAYAAKFRGQQAQIALTTIGNFTQPAASAADSLAAFNRVNGAPATVGQTFILANTQQNDLIAQLNTNSAGMPTATTLNTFTPQQQAVATNRGIDAGHNYAVLSYDPTGAMVRLRNPHNRPGLGGQEFNISLADFQLIFGTLTAKVQ
ncbi:MAG: cadherin-like domain-containing protein [Planctomycetes bacterium]|nr:cadherin-like domain-containing protein [Planctomycetota bacterium]